MRPCQVINFIVRTSKKYILFVLFKLCIMIVAREMYNSICHLIIIILLHALLLYFYIINDCNRNLN